MAIKKDRKFLFLLATNLSQFFLITAHLPAEIRLSHLNRQSQRLNKWHNSTKPYKLISSR
jgi:hypothetical protein